MHFDISIRTFFRFRSVSGVLPVKSVIFTKVSVFTGPIGPVSRCDNGPVVSKLYCAVAYHNLVVNSLI